MVVLVCAKIKAPKLQLLQESEVMAERDQVTIGDDTTVLPNPKWGWVSCHHGSSVPQSSRDVSSGDFGFILLSHPEIEPKGEPQGLSSCFALQCLLKLGDKCRVILCSFERRDLEDVLATSSLHRRVLQPEGPQRATSQTCHHQVLESLFQQVRSR